MRPELASIMLTNGELLRLGDFITVTRRPSGGPEVGTLCKVVIIHAHGTVRVTPLGQKYSYAKNKKNIALYDGDLALDSGL